MEDSTRPSDCTLHPRVWHPFSQKTESPCNSRCLDNIKDDIHTLSEDEVQEKNLKTLDAEVLSNNMKDEEGSSRRLVSGDVVEFRPIREFLGLHLTDMPSTAMPSTTITTQAGLGLPLTVAAGGCNCGVPTERYFFPHGALTTHHNYMSSISHSSSPSTLPQSPDHKSRDCASKYEKPKCRRQDLASAKMNLEDSLARTLCVPTVKSRHRLKKDSQLNQWFSFAEGFKSSGGLSHQVLVFLLFLLVGSSSAFTQESADEMPHQEVEGWATTMGNHLATLVDAVTEFKAIQERYDKHKATVRAIDGVTHVKEMARDVENMLGYKLQAVRRIMNVAEESFKDSASKGHGGDNSKLHYANAKKLLPHARGTNDSSRTDFPHDVAQIELTPNRHFNDLEVNTQMSSIHVPTNVFDRSPEVLNAIRWSETLDRTFVSNYELDPTLHWQFFGSSVGFLRQYPASPWEMKQGEADLYDARLRSWYIRAANTPKDMIILLDVSGSMTGLRQEIAKHVVLNILDTLNENDFVNIFTFSETTNVLVPCFNDTLVQANLENIGEFKMALANIKTEQIANFSQALTEAFLLLAKHNENGQGSHCNQAIMLVTDGAPYRHQEIFNEFNWPQRQVRLFTYLIGREVTDIGKLLWMACANKGYFVHVSTLAEVREQVLKYIPVIARPLVMYRDKHPHIWTSVYADVAHAERGYVVTRAFDPQKILKIAGRPDKVFGRRYRRGSKSGYKLMTSVSVPVFDLNDTSVKTANLLGVAGTDVPIEEIQKLVPPYKLGVNGYSFIVNHNGHILYHPDLRPVHEESNAEVFRRSRAKREWFQDILKPNYNSVDLSEVELPDEEYDEPRLNNSELMGMRQLMINQQRAYHDFTVRVHLDNMKRVVVRKQEYHSAPIAGTPFSLGIALPSATPRPYEVAGEIEISRTEGDVTAFLQNGSWNVHPEWVYCEYKYEQPLDAPYMESQEALLLHFLGKAQKPGWRWSSTRTNQPPDSTPENCDKELIQSLLFDAQVTDVYNKNHNDSASGTGTTINKHPYSRSGINTAFVATRSGLTRWQDTMDKPSLKPGEAHFMETNNKAIDETWYKRAVDYYHQDPDAYVYSVPFDAGTRDANDVLVTVSKAVFIRKNDFLAAPAAVVGATITLEKFIDYFKNETKKCSRPGCKQEKLCSSNDLDCYLLDDSGFIVASERPENTGRFFGEIEGTIMNSLVMSEVYNQVKVYDYQAVCLDIVREGSIASILLTPVQMMKWTISWLSTNLVWIMLKTQLYQLWDANQAWAYTHGTGLEEEEDSMHHDPPPPPDSPVFNVQMSWPPSEMPPEFEGQGGTVRAPAIKTTATKQDAPQIGTDGAPQHGLSPVAPSPEATVTYPPDAQERTYNNHRTRRDAKTVVEVVKSDEVPYNIAADYEYVIANVSIYDDGNFYNLTANEIEVEAVNYEELIEGKHENDDVYDEETTIGDEYDEGLDELGHTGEMEGFPKIELAYINKTRPRPCDKEVTLYTLNIPRLKDHNGEYRAVKGKLSNCHSNGCGRPFSVQKIMKTNLVLIVVNNRCPCDSQIVDIEPKEVPYNYSLHCQHLLTSNYRKRPEDCFSYHPDEPQLSSIELSEGEINICGACAFGPCLITLLAGLSLLLIQQDGRR